MREDFDLMEETNKDEAIRAFELGKEAFKEKDFQRAKKLLSKSIQLYKTDQAIHFLFLAEQQLSNPQQSSSSSSTSTNSTNNNHKSESSSKSEHRETKKENKSENKTNSSSSRHHQHEQQQQQEQKSSMNDENNKNKNNHNDNKKSSTQTTTPSNPSSSTDSPGQAYSEKQKYEVDRIISVTDYYEILSITKTSSEEEVKRAYKKVLFY